MSGQTRIRTRETIRILVCSAGSNGDGIVDIELAADGTVTERARVPAANPAFLSVHPDGKSLYTVERAAGGRVASYRLNGGCGDLARLNDRSSEGAGLLC
ncbi:6-phosphogluconolactonase [Natrialba taiwanensis DSM 12281]|uniref:6-phosphogluconolactonase n=1 Tax=Natrialba taiwanensis DSM 12281 TaxID=1230458 RepID=M0A0B4_9EURY|nr:beta-propeller fold lactonase family protein [Natrialba taiwanensis]ELY92200.1 6-phosphogluconolactonase [Natrialba taiwanensis DSM 12281]